MIQHAASASSYTIESEHQSLIQLPFTPGNAGDQNMQHSTSAMPTQLGGQQTDSEGNGRVWSCRAVKSSMSGGSAREHSPPKSPATQSLKPGLEEENPVIAGRPKDRPLMPQHLLAPAFHNIGTPPGPGNYTGSPGRRPWLDEYMDAAFPNPSNPNSSYPNPPQMPHPPPPIVQRPAAEYFKPLTEAEQLRIRMIENSATKTLSDIEELHRLRQQDEAYRTQRNAENYGKSGFPSGPASSPTTTPFPISKGNEAGPSPCSCQCRRIEEVTASQKQTGREDGELNWESFMQGPSQMPGPTVLPPFPTSNAGIDLSLIHI